LFSAGWTPSGWGNLNPFIEIKILWLDNEVGLTILAPFCFLIHIFIHSNSFILQMEYVLGNDFGELS
jgi:hypothetical protein